MPKPKVYDKLFDKPIEGISYNIKEKYLETLSESARNNCSYILAKAYRYEKMLDKDIYEFSWSELDSLIRMYSNQSLQTVYNNISYLRDYINYCIQEKLVQSNTNPLDSIGGEEDMKKYIDVRAAENKYITREQLDDIHEKLVNIRDCIILELLFNGFTSEEVINLKLSDCNYETKTLTLTKCDGSTREINNISDYTIEMIKSTIEDDEYVFNNGIFEDNKFRPRGESQALVETGFVVKNTVSTKFNKTSITNIVSRIKEWVDEPYMTPTTIRVSGMIDYAKQIQTEKGYKDLQKEDYEDINKRYGIVDINGFAWFNTKTKIKNYI